MPLKPSAPEPTLRTSARPPRRILPAAAAALLLLAAAGCAGEGPAVTGGDAGEAAAQVAGYGKGLSDAQVSAVAASIEAASLTVWLEDLADDEMEGRLPGTAGEKKATMYIAKAFEEAGLEPGNDDSYFQKVPLVGITADPAMKMKISGGKKKVKLDYKDDFMAVTTREQERIDAAGEMVFVGYGTIAPEFDWDDYKGVDVSGKVLVMLVGDPPLEDESRFGGRAMTYYGRWTYKYEMAAEMKAAGAMLIHETEAAGYPWGVVAGSWAGEQFVPVRPDGDGDRAPFESWVTHEVAGKLFEMAGLDLSEMKSLAATDSFEPVNMELSASLSFKNKIRRIKSRNVVGLLPGSDLADEWVIFSSHWDHLGISDPVLDDDIYNGAFDNATGVASLIGMARAFAALPQPPRRSMLFLAVTAEEQGLLGSYHYAEQPLHPLARTAALINMDGMNVHGQTEDIIVIGLGNTTMDDLVVQVAETQDRVVRPDQEPEKGFYYRSDQFPFAKKGVPALYTDHGIDYVGRPEGWGKEQNARYTRENYHKPSDEFDPAWDLSGMVEDTRLLFRVGLLTAQADHGPEWKEGAEFKSIRDRALAATGGR
jgi:Zn-dependent M28 family amino/carboxypeptidase